MPKPNFNMAIAHQPTSKDKSLVVYARKELTDPCAECFLEPHDLGFIRQDIASLVMPQNLAIKVIDQRRNRRASPG
ncbi:MAG: hypothetical protein MUC38_14100, partial [Cyclobacteriaceae bacterium]|nr:hypothetical protein [Cyclobacteriaceae bacterium]